MKLLLGLVANFLFSFSPQLRAESRKQSGFPALPKEFKWQVRDANNKKCEGSDEDFLKSIYIQNKEMTKDAYIKLPGKVFLSNAGRYKVPKDHSISYSFSSSMEKAGFQQVRLPISSLNILVSGPASDGPNGGVVGFVNYKDDRFRMAAFSESVRSDCDDDKETCWNKSKNIDPSYCLEVFFSDPIELKKILPEKFK